MPVDEMEMRARVGDEWVPVTRASEFTLSDLRDPDEPDDTGETFADLGEKTWKMTIELAENEPVISLIRRLEREERQRRMLARWWLRFPFASRVRCSAGVLL